MHTLASSSWIFRRYANKKALWLSLMAARSLNIARLGSVFWAISKAYDQPLNMPLPLKERAGKVRPLRPLWPKPDGKQKMHELEENLARRVQESPMKSVLIAAGVGLVLGFLWRRS